MTWDAQRPVPEKYNFKCRVCGSSNVHYQEWDEHEDYKYECKGCGCTWIVEGDDG